VAPGRALPERTAVGLAGHQLQFYSASGAINLEDLSPQHRPPSAAGAGGTWGRHFTQSGKAAGVFGVGEGVEYHGRFATHFKFLGIPMWLPLLLTLPLLAIAARQMYLLRGSARRRQDGVCVYCGQELPPGAERCVACGHAQPTVDPVTAVFLAGAPAATPAAGSSPTTAPPAVTTPHPRD
jgi:hypothetical protein